MAKHKNVFNQIFDNPEVARDANILFDLWSSLRTIVEKEQYTQSQLTDILGVPQSRVSEFTSGKLAKLSVRRLIEYADKLNAQIEFKVTYKNATVPPRKLA